MKTDFFDDIDNKKKRLILEAALKEFSLKGYAATTTRDIAKAANVSNGLLFYYFKDKNTLFFKLINYSSEHILKIILSELKEDLNYFDALKQLCITKLELSVEYPEAYKLLMEEVAYFPQQFKQDNIRIKLEIEKKLCFIEKCNKTIFKKDLNTVLIKEILVSALEGMTEQLISAYRSGNITMEDVLRIGVEKADIYLNFFSNNFTLDN
jgi:AcrR family transcriptional regulator